MSGQYGLTKLEEQEIINILEKHQVYPDQNEVSIHISGYDDEEEKIKKDMYIQID